MENKNKKEFGFEAISVKNFDFDANRMPIIKEINGQDWVKFGADNLYPDYLLSLFQKSPKLSPILSSISDMIVGNGFNITPNLEPFFNNVNNKESLHKMLPKLAFDLVVYGAFSLIVIWSRDKKSIAQIKYNNVNKLRCGKSEDEDEVEYFYVSNNWKNYRQTQNLPQKFQGFSQTSKEEVIQVIYAKKYRPGLEFYSLPHWISAVNYVELDWEISNYHLQATLNGYMPGLAINLSSGIPTKEKQLEIKKKLDNQFKGTNNAEKVFLTFSEKGESGVQIQKIDLNTSDKRFIELEKQIQDNIYNANKATSPMLFGGRVAGSLGGKNELLEAFEMYQMTVVSKFQELICQTLQELSEINGIKDKIEIKPYQIFKEITKQTEGEIA